MDYLKVFSPPQTELSWLACIFN